LQITVHRFQGAYNIRLRSNTAQFYKSKANDFINPEEQASSSLAAVKRAIRELRGDGLLCKPHEPALVQAPARLRANVPSCLLSSTSYVLRRGVRGVSGRSPEFAFLLQAFSFSNKKKMPKRCKR